MSDGYDDGIEIPKIAPPKRPKDPNSVCGLLRGMPAGKSKFFAGKTPVAMHGFVWAIRKERPSVRFTSRTVVENGVKGVRVWRLDAE